MPPPDEWATMTMIIAQSRAYRMLTLLESAEFATDSGNVGLFMTCCQDCVLSCLHKALSRFSRRSLLQLLTAVSWVAVDVLRRCRTLFRWLTQAASGITILSTETSAGRFAQTSHSDESEIRNHELYSWLCRPGELTW